MALVRSDMSTFMHDMECTIQRRGDSEEHFSFVVGKVTIVANSQRLSKLNLKLVSFRQWQVKVEDCGDNEDCTLVNENSCFDLKIRQAK